MFLLLLVMSMWWLVKLIIGLLVCSVELCLVVFFVVFMVCFVEYGLVL